MRLGETPVPIPNTMVKPFTADGTALATVWESRWMPDQTLINHFYKYLSINCTLKTSYRNILSNQDKMKC